MALRYTHESDFRQERDFGQKISATFEFIGAHWRPLGKVLLYLVVPLALLRGVIEGIFQSRMFSAMSGGFGVTSPGVLSAQQAQMLASLQSPFYYLTLLLSTAFSAVLFLSIYGYLVLCLRPAGAASDPITPGAVWAVVRQRLVGTFFSLWGVGILIGLGFLVLFVPGVYLLITLSLFFVVSAVEGTGFGPTINRCVSLIKGKWWSTFGLMGIMLLLIYLLFIGIGIVAKLLGTSVRGVFAFAVDAPLLFTIVVTLFSTLLTLLFYPPILLALAFQYFNLVERREGVGLSHLVGQLGQAPLAGPGGTTYRPSEEGEY